MINRLLIGAVLALSGLPASAAPAAPTPAAPTPAAPVAAAKPAGDPAKASGAPDTGGSITIRVRVPRGDPRFASVPPSALQGDVLSVSLADDAFASVPMAAVEDEVITVDDMRELASLTHMERSEGKAGRMDFAALLDRLIGVRVIAVEARDMGLDDLDEVKQAIAANREKIRFELVRRRAIAGVKPDAAVVDRRYKEAAREWKLRSVVFSKRDDAVAFGAALAGGKDFEKLATKAVADGKAKGGDARWMRVNAIAADVAKRVRALKRGQTSAPIEVKEGWTLIRLEEARAADDATLRSQTEAAVANENAKKVLETYYAGLKKKFVTIDKAVLKSVNFDSPKPGFAALRKDTRVVARVQGSDAITVGDIAAELAKPLFHGIESAQKEKRLNVQKGEALESLVSRRLLVIEATRLAVDESPEARRMAKEFETNLLFTTYIDKVVIPEVKVTDAELKQAYEKRKKEFTYPAFYKLHGLPFADAKKAQAALKSLQGGTDFKWLKNNADGLVAPDKKALVLDGSTFSATQMPEELRKVLTGVREGDYRLYDQAGQHFVIQVQAYTPERIRPFEEVQGELGKAVYGAALNRKLDEWVGKLRQAHHVTVFLVSGK